MEGVKYNMKKELEEKLFEKYPHLLRGRHYSIKENLLPFGIACGNGWFDLIDKTLAKIKEKDEEVLVTQIKEKYAELRIYVNEASLEVYDIIHEAEEKSRTVCERCGKHNAEVRSKGGWFKTLCDSCYAEWKRSWE